MRDGWDPEGPLAKAGMRPGGVWPEDHPRYVAAFLYHNEGYVFRNDRHYLYDVEEWGQKNPDLVREALPEYFPDHPDQSDYDKGYSDGEKYGYDLKLEAIANQLNNHLNGNLKIVDGKLKGTLPGIIPEIGQEAQRELTRIRAREQAKELYRAETEPPREPLTISTLEDVLKLPPEPPGRIPGEIPWNASSLLAAQRKTGKTTLLLNLAWSFLTGKPFLGKFEVTPLEGDLAFLNYELNPHTFGQWADQVGIPAERMHVLNLRG